MHPDISVIVPVYEVEPYLPTCLDSLIAQTKKEIEILVVDDGSPDNCGRICDEYAAKDSRIRVIHQENRGLSAARNIALDIAAGDYVMFADSDDWVLPTFCETAYRLITEHDADIVIFAYERWRDSRSVPIHLPDEAEGLKTQREACALLYTEIGDYSWNKICRRSLFDSIRFPEGRLYEDVGTTYRLVFLAKRIWYAPEVLYYYRDRPGSIVNSPSAKSRIDHYELSQQKLSALEARSDTRGIADEQRKMLSFSYCMAFRPDPADPYWIESERVLMDCRPRIPKDFPWKRKISIVLFWYCRGLFDFLCTATKRRVD